MFELDRVPRDDEPLMSRPASIVAIFSFYGIGSWNVQSLLIEPVFSGFERSAAVA
jgi:hypothetical protein